MKKNRVLSYILVLVLMSFILTSCKNNENDNNSDNTKVTPVPTETTVNDDPNALIADKPDDISSWAAIYETEKAILTFNSDGSVTYKDKEYDSYRLDGTFLILNDDGTELKMRYTMKNKKMLLYDNKDYFRVNVSGKYTEADNDDNSIIGLWVFDEKYTYEFTEKGTFYEDSNFPGHYEVNNDEHSVKLMYNDHFEDSILYYSRSGSKLTIEYPWSMVPTTASK